MASISIDASVSLALAKEFGIKFIPKFRQLQGVARVELLVGLQRCIVIRHVLT
jgi:hypothetical protein